LARPLIHSPSRLATRSTVIGRCGLSAMRLMPTPRELPARWRCRGRMASSPVEGVFHTALVSHLAMGPSSRSGLSTHHLDVAVQVADGPATRLGSGTCTHGKVARNSPKGVPVRGGGQSAHRLAGQRVGARWRRRRGGCAVRRLDKNA
jgi:hypothetical protein